MERPARGPGLRNAIQSPTVFEPCARSISPGAALWCPRARHGLQGPVLPSPDGQGPAARVRRPGVDRCARLLDPREAPGGVRERRPSPALRRRGVAPALPRRDVAVPAGDARIPVHGRPVHGRPRPGLHRAAVPGPDPPRRGWPGRPAAAGAAGGAVQRSAPLDRAGRDGGPHRPGEGGAGALSAVAAVLPA